MTRCGRAISPSVGAADSSRSRSCSVSVAAAFNRLANEASDRGSGLAAVRAMGRIVLNSRAMTSSGSSRRTGFRVVRALILAVLALLLLPYLLTPLYRVLNPVSTLMLARWATGQRVERTTVPLERVAPVLPRTVLASEDARFCSHRGVDLVELREAFEEADDVSEMRGGSTIAQQTVKNLF